MTPKDPAGALPDRGSRLLALLGLPHEAPVLVTGDALPGWEAEFPNAQREGSGVGEGPWCLVVGGAGSAGSPAGLQSWLRTARASLAPEGFLILLCHDPWSVLALARVLAGRRAKGEAIPEAPGFRRGAGWTSQAATRAGFRFVDRYLCFPNLTRPVEILRPESRFLELPRSAHPIYRLARFPALRGTIHPSYLLVCGERDWQDSPLIREARELKGTAGQANSRCEPVAITRFDVRRRGALTLFMEGKHEGEGDRIGRLVAGGERGNQVERNHSFVGILHSGGDLAEWCRSRVPEPIGVVEGTDGRRVYIEALLPGVLAWKVPWSRVGTFLQADATRFLRDFARSFARSHVLDTEVLGRLFGRERELVMTSPYLLDDERRQLIALMDWLAGSLGGRTLPVTYGHGDFGIGNVLVDPARGRMTGVIDWETGRTWELPGVDRLNWEIQRIRNESGVPFTIAAERVADRICGPGGDGAEWCHPMGPDSAREVRRSLLLTCGLRYVCRALRYPELFREESRDLMRGIARLQGLMDPED